METTDKESLASRALRMKEAWHPSTDMGANAADPSTGRCDVGCRGLGSDAPLERGSAYSSPHCWIFQVAFLFETATCAGGFQSFLWAEGARRLLASRLCRRANRHLRHAPTTLVPMAGERLPKPRSLRPTLQERSLGCALFGRATTDRTCTSDVNNKQSQKKMSRTCCSSTRLCETLRASSSHSNLAVDCCQFHFLSQRQESVWPNTAGTLHTAWAATGRTL